jgi:hypothetical protein
MIMASKTFGIGAGTAGVVAILVLGGALLTLFVPESSMGVIAIGTGVILGVVLASIGIFALVKRLS